MHNATFYIKIFAICSLICLLFASNLPSKGQAPSHDICLLTFLLASLSSALKEPTCLFGLCRCCLTLREIDASSSVRVLGSTDRFRLTCAYFLLCSLDFAPFPQIYGMKWSSFFCTLTPLSISSPFCGNDGPLQLLTKDGSTPT